MEHVNTLKNQRSIVVEYGKIDDNEDKLSQLYDGLLHHILSFLPTKDAVKTCILSTRWQHLWLSVTNLDHGHEECSSSHYQCDCKTKSVHFMERVLLLHSAKIMRFRICCPDNYFVHGTRLNSWIYSVLNRQVQVIDLELRSGPELVLPRPLCNCYTLTELRISSSCELRFPALISFSSLKTLRFINVIFLDDLSVHKLFTELPVVEELELTKCGWNHIRKASIDIPSLRKLTLDISHYPVYRRGDIQYISECQFEVYAENLQYLSCKSQLSIDLFLHTFPSLDYVFMKLARSANQHPKGRLKNASKLLNGIRFAKFVEVPADTLTIFEEDTWSTEPLSGTLEFGVFGFRGAEAEISTLKFILKISTALEKMKINYCNWVRLTAVAKAREQLESGPIASKNCVIEFVEEPSCYIIRDKPNRRR